MTLIRVVCRSILWLAVLWADASQGDVSWSRRKTKCKDQGAIVWKAKESKLLAQGESWAILKQFP